MQEYRLQSCCLATDPRTILDLLIPKVSDRVQQKQEQQKSSHDRFLGAIQATVDN